MSEIYNLVQESNINLSGSNEKIPLLLHQLKNIKEITGLREKCQNLKQKIILALEKHNQMITNKLLEFEMTLSLADKEEKPKTKPSFFCFIETCNQKSFTTHWSLKKHLARVHSTIDRKDYIYKCPLDTCERRFFDLYDLKRHRAKHCQMFQCDKCIRKFTDHSNLQRHRRRIHLKLDRFPCPEPNCAKNYSRKSLVKVHIKKITYKTRLKKDIFSLKNRQNRLINLKQLH